MFKYYNRVPGASTNPEIMKKNNPVYIYCDGRSTRQTQWVWRQASERLLLNRNNTIKVSKGNKVSKIKGGIWCPRCAARVVKEGQCSGRKGPGKGRSPAAARAPLRGPGREGRWLFQRLRPPLGPRQHSMGLVGPASWPDGRLAGAVLVRTEGPAARAFGGTRSLNAPFLDPRGHQRACTGKRPVSRGEAQPAYNSGGDEAPFTSGVCLITRRQTWLLQRPSSLTHPLPSGAWWRAAIKGRGVLTIRGEAADSSHSPPQATSPSSGRRPRRSATFLNQAPAVGVGGAGIPLRATLPLAPRRNRDRETGF